MGGGGGGSGSSGGEVDCGNLEGAKRAGERVNEPTASAANYSLTSAGEATVTQPVNGVDSC